LRDVNRDGGESAGQRQKEGKVDLYLFPDPGLLRPKFYKNWLLSRQMWIWRASQREIGVKPLSPSMWRDCLFYGLATGLSTIRYDSKEFDKIRKTALALGCDLDKSGQIVLPGRMPAADVVGDKGVMKWKGLEVRLKADGTMEDGLVKEMLWELFEMSFRVELQALDKELMKATDLDNILDRQDMVRNCFAGREGAEFVLYPPTIPEENVGMASDLLEDRRPYIIALARLMHDWPVRKPNGWQELAPFRKLSMAQVENLELLVTRLYCQTFYDVRRRAPLTPHKIKRV